MGLETVTKNCYQNNVSQGIIFLHSSPLWCDETLFMPSTCNGASGHPLCVESRIERASVA
eukprot:2957772-Amphidinium_carterae.1